MRLSLLARFVLLSAAFGVCVWSTQETLAAAVLPVMQAEIQQLEDGFRVDRLFVTHEAGEPVIRLEVGLARAITVNGHTYFPDPRGTAVSSTLLGNLLLPTVLVLASAFAAPVARATALLVRLLAVSVALVLVWAADIPFILLAGLWRIVFAAAGATGFAPLLMWSDFLQAGGSNVLALAGGMAAAQLTDRHASHNQNRQQAA